MIKEYAVLLPLQNKIFQPSPLYLLPIKKIFEKRWNSNIWKFIWELYISFPMHWRLRSLQEKQEKVQMPKQKSDWLQI